MSNLNIDLSEEAQRIQEETLPPSRELYKQVFGKFKEWALEKNYVGTPEDLILVYLKHLSEKYAPSTLWSKYSMLRSMILIENNVDISNYAKVKSFIKQKNIGYEAKKSRVFTEEEVQKFVNDASDIDFLAHKVYTILGLSGCCRKVELYNMKPEDMEDNGMNVMIKIPKTKNGNPRSFVVAGEFYKYYKKYAALRPLNAKKANFFLKFQKGKCHN